MNTSQKKRFLSEIYPSPLDCLRLKQLCERVHEKSSAGWFPATAGNFSIRSSKKDLFYVSPSSVDKRILAWNTFVPMDIKANTLGACPEKPSLEALIHLGIYQQVPEAKVIFHAHSPFLSKALISKKEDLILPSNELLKIFGEAIYEQGSLSIKVAPNPHPKELVQFMPTLKNYLSKETNSVLFADHGIYAFGEELLKVVATIEALERLCELHTI